jgi:hypothetical protein
MDGGGSSLPIEEFLAQYTPVEVEKLEQGDPLKRFNEKISVFGQSAKENLSTQTL